VSESVRPKAAGVDGQLVQGTGVFAKYANFVKLPHTLFALPFAFVGVTLASFVVDVHLDVVVWSAVAFTAARFAAMGFNRIVDREFDARNPRTAMRELPTGSMRLGEARAAVVVACIVFEVAAWRLNPVCFALSPIALGWIFLYSYTKRFTRWSHLVLGLGLGIAPVGGYLAVTGGWSDPWWALPVLAYAVMAWTAGFDIIYSLQDIEVDRAEGLHSLPSRLGAGPALMVARALHATVPAAFILVGRMVSAGLWYHIGVALAAGLLVYEQVLASKGKVQKAFFAVNMSLSALFLAFVILERLLPFVPVWP
jgi:4-hydroxybenzoate polyprenyltransferase